MHISTYTFVSNLRQGRRGGRKRRRSRRFQEQLLLPSHANISIFLNSPIPPSPFLEDPVQNLISSSSTTLPIATGEASEETMKRNQDPKKVMMNGNGTVVLVKRVVRYRECRKNHAASVGGYAVDGCREFMASDEEGTAGAFKCAACNCHRSFHKREVEREVLCDCSSNTASPR